MHIERPASCLTGRHSCALEIDSRNIGQRFTASTENAELGLTAARHPQDAAGEGSVAHVTRIFVHLSLWVAWRRSIRWRCQHVLKLLHDVVGLARPREKTGKGRPRTETPAPAARQAPSAAEEPRSLALEGTAAHGLRDNFPLVLFDPDSRATRGDDASGQLTQLRRPTIKQLKDRADGGDAVLLEISWTPRQCGAAP